MIVWATEDGLFLQRLGIGREAPYITVDEPTTLIVGDYAHPKVSWGPGQWFLVFREGAGETIRHASAGTLNGLFWPEVLWLTTRQALTSPVARAMAWHVSTNDPPFARIARINGIGIIESDEPIGAVPGDSVIHSSAGPSGGIVGWSSPGGAFAGRPMTSEFLRDTVRPVSEIGSVVQQAAVAMGVVLAGLHGLPMAQ